MGAPDLGFSPEEKRTLLGLARRTLEASTAVPPSDPLVAFWRTCSPEGPWHRLLPCFVSLFTRSDRLRGCIGCVETEHRLAENIVRMTRLAALQDSRFTPVSAKEARELVIHISVLGPLRALPSLDQVELGRHGLLVRRAPRQGVLLAEVPVRFGWKREEFLAQTFYKAGLDASRPEGCEVFYFEETDFSEED